jgi:Dolichyl-phosphate-mannose-protein mannosyltransferase
VFFKLGAVQPLLLFAHGWLANSIGGTLDATTWTISGVLVSCVSVWCAYWLMRDHFGPHAGVLAALLLAFSPAHNFTGRSLAAPWAHELALQLALLLSASRHFSNPTRSRGIVWYTLLAVYIWCGNQMFGIVPVLGYALMTARLSAQTPEGWVPFLRSRLLSPGIAVVAVSGCALWYATLVARQGHLYHALFDKKKVPGLYVDNWLSDVVHNLGYVPAALVLVSLLVLPFFVKRVFDWKLLPLVYCLCYSLPFWFLISPKTTQTFTQGYSIYGISGLILVFVATMSQLAVYKVRSYVEVVVALALLVGTGSSVYRYYAGDLLGAQD